MRTLLHRLFGFTRTRGFDAAGGGRRWEGARTVDGLNTAILAGATTAARRAGWYQCGRPAILEPALAVWRGGDLMSPGTVIEEFVHIEKGLGPNGRIAVVRFDRGVKGSVTWTRIRTY